MAQEAGKSLAKSFWCISLILWKIHVLSAIKILRLQLNNFIYSHGRHNTRPSCRYDKINCTNDSWQIGWDDMPKLKYLLRRPMVFHIIWCRTFGWNNYSGWLYQIKYIHHFAGSLWYKTGRDMSVVLCELPYPGRASSIIVSFPQNHSAPFCRYKKLSARNLCRFVHSLRWWCYTVQIVIVSKKQTPMSSQTQDKHGDLWFYVYSCLILLHHTKLWDRTIPGSPYDHLQNTNNWLF